MLRSLTVGLALVFAPLALNAQAITKCADGTTSTASGRGACSGHGGVAKASAKAAKSDMKAATKTAKSDQKTETKAGKAETKTAKAETKAATKPAKAENKATASADANGATAKCKDGTYSHAASRRGACSRHGGVAEWLKS